MQHINWNEVDALTAKLDANADPFANLSDDLGPVAAKPQLQVINGGMADNAKSMDDAANILRFLDGGNATFTVRNAKSGNRLTFRVSKPRKENGQIDHSANARFVSVLNGSDNESNYAYVGAIFQNVAGARFTLTKKSRVTRDAPSYRVFEALWRQLNSVYDSRLPNGIEFFHSGKCARCGRTLTVPESIESGFGPECITKM